MTTACTDPHTPRQINISPDIARALTGTFAGYIVRLHGLPVYTFRVEAPTADAAHALAVAVVRRERHLPQTGATIQATT